MPLQAVLPIVHMNFNEITNFLGQFLTTKISIGIEHNTHVWLDLFVSKCSVNIQEFERRCIEKMPGLSRYLDRRLLNIGKASMKG